MPTRIMAATVAALAVTTGCAGSRGEVAPASDDIPSSSDRPSSAAANSTPSAAADRNRPSAAADPTPPSDAADPAPARPAPLPKRTRATDEAQLRSLSLAWSVHARRISQRPDPNDPALEQFLVGELLEEYRTEFARERREQVRSRTSDDGRTRFWIERVTVRGATAVLHECAIDDDVMYRFTSGEVIDDRTATLSIRTEAVRLGSSWRLSARTATVAEGVVGCALDG